MHPAVRLAPSSSLAPQTEEEQSAIDATVFVLVTHLRPKQKRIKPSIFPPNREMLTRDPS